MTADPVLLESSPALPLVWVTVALGHGATLDPPDKEGTTRLLARLMRRTGGGVSPREIDERIDTLGASLSVESSHSVCAFGGITTKRSFDAFVDVLVDVVARPGLAESELRRLQRETQSELTEALDDDSTLCRRWFRRRLFRDHPYGRPVSGTASTVDNIGSGDLEQLRARLVVSGNLVIALAGDLDRSEADATASRIRSAIAEGGSPTDPVPEPTALRGRHLVFVDKPERTQTQILIGGLGTHPTDADHFALHVANTVFGGTFTARLTQEVRAKRGWSYGAYSSLPIDRRRRGFSMWTFPKAGDAAPCIALQLEMLKKWRTEGIDAEELEWAKRYLVRSHAFAVDTAAKRVGQALDTALYQLPADYHSSYLERIEAVTLQQANDAVRNRISSDDLLLVVVGTEADVGSAVRDACGELASAEVVAFDSE